MSEIPEDVLAAAREAINSAVDDRGALGVIARAILAERERCAAVARGAQLYEGDFLKNSDPRATIADAIMRGAAQ